MRAAAKSKNIDPVQPNTLPRLAELVSGPTLEYSEQGDARGVPVVHLHGYTDSRRSFDPILPHLPRNIRAIALSQRGHGNSERPATGYHPRDMASDLVRFFDALGLERAVVVGHSMGSLVALRFALASPDRVLGLVTAGGFATLGENPIIAELKAEVATLRDPVDAGFAREFQSSTFARPYDEAFLDMVVGESLKVPAHVWQEALDGQIEDDATAELGRVGAPTLIAWGDRDEIATRPMQDRLAGRIPRSRLVVFHGVGHALHWDDPRGFAAELVKFVEEHGPA